MLKSIILSVKIYFLKKELQNSGRFFIGGYGRSMVRIIGKRFLDDWEVTQVHKWEQEGKIIEDGLRTITSPHGDTYTERMYSWNKYMVKKDHKAAQARVDEIFKREPKHDIKDFKVDQIVKFDAGYHTTKPYYAKVVYVNTRIPFTGTALLLVTEIPGKRRCEIWHRNNFDYHIRRMTIIGFETEENKHLLYGQTLD